MDQSSEIFGTGEVQSGKFLVQTVLLRMEVGNPKGGTSFKFAVWVLENVWRSQLDQGGSKEDLTMEWLCPNCPKLGMDASTGAGGWKGIEGGNEEMPFHSSGTRTEILLPAGNVPCSRGTNSFPQSSLALTLCRCSLKTAVTTQPELNPPSKHTCGGKHRSHFNLVI